MMSEKEYSFSFFPPERVKDDCMLQTVLEESPASLHGELGYRQEEGGAVPSSYASSGADAFVRRRANT